MSVSRLRQIGAFGFVVGCIGLAAFAAIKAQNPKYSPKQTAVTQFIVHLPNPKCAMQGYLILGGHTSGEMDSGDLYNQELWDLVDKCGGWIEVQAPKLDPHWKVPRPSRNG